MDYIPITHPTLFVLSPAPECIYYYRLQRVRRSPFATNPQFGEAQEMTCTMRNWHPQNHRHHSSSAAGAAPPMMGHDISNISNIMGGSSTNEQRSSSRSRRGMPPYLKKRNTACKTTQDSCNNGCPELLMTPIHDILTNRDASPLRTKPPVVRKRTKSIESANNPADDQQQQHESASALRQDQYHFTNGADDNGISTITLASFSIPLHDIVVVEAKHPSQHQYPHHVSSSSRRRRNHHIQHHHHHHLQQGQGHRLLLTTMENGYLEFNCATSNGHDVLYAFLQASISPERIVVAAVDEDIEDRSLPSAASKASSSVSCMDVDRLTAQQIQGAELSETWPQRLSRRVGKVVHTLTEVSETLCDMANCCRENSGTGNLHPGTGAPSTTTSGVPGGHSPPYHHVSSSENRDMPPPPLSVMQPSSPTRSHHSAAGAAASHHGTTGISTSMVGCLEMVDDDVASCQSSSCYQSGSLSRNIYFQANNNANDTEKKHCDESSLSYGHLTLAQTNHGNKCGLVVEPDDPALETMYHDN
jgi:hypothetical protein